MKNSELESFLAAINSTGDMGFKYPIGNPELTNKIKDLESRNIICYIEAYGRWSKVLGRNNDEVYRKLTKT